MFLITSVHGLKGNRLVLRKSGPLTQLLDCKISADLPRVPATAGSSLVTTWCHSSTLVCSKISLTQFAIIIGCLVVDINHCKTVVLWVLMTNLLTITVRALQISCFNRAASSAACNSSFGTIVTFKVYTSFTQDKDTLRLGSNRSIYLSSEECNGTEDFLRTIAERL